MVSGGESFACDTFGGSCGELRCDGVSRSGDESARSAHGFPRPYFRSSVNFRPIDANPIRAGMHTHPTSCCYIHPAIHLAMILPSAALCALAAVSTGATSGSVTFFSCVTALATEGGAVATTGPTGASGRRDKGGIGANAA